MNGYDKCHQLLNSKENPILIMKNIKKISSFYHNLYFKIWLILHFTTEQNKVISGYYEYK